MELFPVKKKSSSNTTKATAQGSQFAAARTNWSDPPIPRCAQPPGPFPAAVSHLAPRCSSCHSDAQIGMLFSTHTWIAPPQMEFTGCYHRSAPSASTIINRAKKERNNEMQEQYFQTEHTTLSKFQTGSSNIYNMGNWNVANYSLGEIKITTFKIIFWKITPFV